MLGKSPVRAAGCVLTMLLLAQGVTCWLCYSTGNAIGLDFCPGGTCYSVGGKAFGLTVAKRGCAEKTYAAGICQRMDFMGTFGEEVCFCNSFLCNASPSLKPLLLPLLLLPALALLLQ